MSDKSHSEVLSQIKQDNLHSAALAAKASPELIEQLAIDAMTTTDADLRRKILETLHKVGWSAEPKAAQTSFQMAHFSIVLDDSVVQVRPGAPRPAPPVLIEEYDPTPLPPAAVPTAVDVDDLAYSLLAAADD